MKTIIENLFGTYTPLTDSSGSVVTTVAGLDFTWLAGVCLFGLTLYCIFRLIGALLR